MNKNSEPLYKNAKSSVFLSKVPKSAVVIKEVNKGDFTEVSFSRVKYQVLDIIIILKLNQFLILNLSLKINNFLEVILKDF